MSSQESMKSNTNEGPQAQLWRKEKICMMASEKGGGGHTLGAKLEKKNLHVACEFTL